MEMLKQSVNAPEPSLKKIIMERRATLSFDGSPVPDNVLLDILQAGMQSPSGYNIQPWRFIVVREAEQKSRLCGAAMDQSKVEEAGAVIVCCGDLSATHGPSLDKVLAESEKHGFTKAQNDAVKMTLKNVFNAQAGNEMGIGPDFAVWLNRHVMIAFTTMMWMAESLGYDTAPMEGFFEDQVRSVLGIPADVRVVAILCVGKQKGPDKRYAGRRELPEICFAEKWGEGIRL